MLLANLAILVLVVIIVVPASRSTLFRVDAKTDTVTFIAATDLQWGEAPLQVRSFDPPICARGSVRLPAGAAITADHYEEANSISASVGADEGNPLTIECADGRKIAARFVEVRYPSARLPAPNGKNKRGGATASDIQRGLRSLPGYAPTKAIFPISGTGLRLGGAPDANSPAAEVRILNSGTLSSETSSWPISSASIIVNRELVPGDIVSFDNPEPMPIRRGAKDITTPFSGLLIADEDGLRVVARTEGEFAYVTPANAPESKPAIIAPTRLNRLEAQAEWGIFVLIGAAVLSILASTKSLIGEPQVQERTFPWARRASSIVLMCSVASTLGLVPLDDASAQMAQGHPTFRISGGSGGQGQGFLILNPAATPHCLVVTATHVVKPGDVVKLNGVRNIAANAQPQAVETEAIYLDELAPGLIVLKPSGKTDLGECQAMPRLPTSEARLRDDTFGRLAYSEPSGQPRTLRIMIEDDLSISSVAGGVIEPGMSGGLITKGGLPLAVATNIANGAGGIVRLDGLTMNPRYSAVVANPPAVVTPWTNSPFDASKLPKPYREVAQQALTVRSSAETEQRTAVQNAAEADEAVIRAKAGAPGHGTVRPEQQTDRIFQGQLNAAGSSGSGYGKLRYTGGGNSGDEYRGLFRESADGKSFGLAGAAVQTNGNPAVNGKALRYEGGFNVKWDGHGVITYENGDRWLGHWTQNKSDNVVVYLRQSDGARFEMTGGPDGTLSGLGVMWNKAGEPVCLCTWKNGSVIKNETVALLSRLSK